MPAARKRLKLPPTVEADLRFISENMQLSGFSGKITPELVEHMLTLHRRHPVIARGETIVWRVVSGCTRQQRTRLLVTTNEVEFLLKLAEFAIQQTHMWDSLKRAAAATRDKAGPKPKVAVQKPGRSMGKKSPM